MTALRVPLLKGTRQEARRSPSSSSSFGMAADIGAAATSRSEGDGRSGTHAIVGDDHLTACARERGPAPIVIDGEDRWIMVASSRTRGRAGRSRAGPTPQAGAIAGPFAWAPCDGKIIRCNLNRLCKKYTNDDSSTLGRQTADSGFHVSK